MEGEIEGEGGGGKEHHFFPVCQCQVPCRHYSKYAHSDPPARVDRVAQMVPAELFCALRSELQRYAERR